LGTPSWFVVGEGPGEAPLQVSELGLDVGAGDALAGGDALQRGRAQRLGRRGVGEQIERLQAHKRAPVSARRKRLGRGLPHARGREPSGAGRTDLCLSPR
jgi:hypothetical protein